MKLESYLADVVKMLNRCGAPADFFTAAQQAQNISDLRAVCYAYMAWVGQDLTALGDAFDSLGKPVEAARTRAEGNLAQEPWKRIHGAMK